MAKIRQNSVTSKTILYFSAVLLRQPMFYTTISQIVAKTCRMKNEKNENGMRNHKKMHDKCNFLAPRLRLTDKRLKKNGAWL